jgi:hypothetical protein
MQSDEEDTATSTRKQRNKARKAERKAAKKQFNSSKKAKMSENDSAREESTESEPVTLPTIYFKNGAFIGFYTPNIINLDIKREVHLVIQFHQFC